MTVLTHLLASLRFRLLVGLILVFGLGAAAMLGLMRANAFGAHDAVEEKSLDEQASSLLAGLRLNSAGRLVRLDIPAQWRDAYRTPQAAFFNLYDPAGNLVASSGNKKTPLPLRPTPAGRDIGTLRIEGPEQNLALSAAGPRGFQLMVGRTSPGQFDEAHPDVMEDFAPAFLFLLFAGLGLFAVWGVAMVSLSPLVNASREAAAIGPETISRRLTPSKLPTEARPLAHAVNAALDRLSAAYEGEKRFIADAAHALRTPLAVLDLRLQRAQSDGGLDWLAVRRDVAELARLVSGLLSLSRAERDEQPAKQTANLARLAREAAVAFSPRLEAAHRDIDVIAPAEALLTCTDVGALRDMIGVLIDNALTHGRGAITVEIVACEDGALRLRVSDQGQGVAPDAWEEVFGRFHKLDANSPGAGLGLAIARRTALNQGGKACFVAPTTVEVRLPN